LHFPNGITLTESRDALLIVESTRSRILKYYFEGSKKGKTEIFIDNVPGFPDNIVFSEKSHVYWIGFSSKRSKPFHLSDFLSNYPIVRKYLVKFISRSVFLSLYPKYGIIVAFNENGKIVKSLHDPTGTISFISEAVEYQNHLILGTWANDWVIIVDGTKFLPLLH